MSNTTGGATQAILRVKEIPAEMHPRERGYAVEKADAIARLTAQRNKLREALEWYADMFCEAGVDCPDGKYHDDICSGCRARAALKETDNA